MSIVSRLALPLYSVLHWLLDSWRNPDLMLAFTRSEAETKYWISGYASWERLRTFDARGRSNGVCIGRYFEISPENVAYLHRWPDIRSTEHYPASFGILGTVRADPAGGSKLCAWYRLTNLRALFFGFIMLLSLLAAAAILLLPSLPVDERILIGMALLFSVAFLPLSIVCVVLTAGRISSRKHVEELARYLMQLSDEDDRAA